MEEGAKIRTIEDVNGYPLICSKLRKVYGKKKVAVSELDLIVNDN